MTNVGTSSASACGVQQHAMSLFSMEPIYTNDFQRSDIDVLSRDRYPRSIPNSLTHGWEECGGRREGGSCLEPSHPVTGRLRKVPVGKERKVWPPSILSEKGVESQHKD